MTIEFLPWDVSPSSPIYYYQENNETIERQFPLKADFIDEVWAGSILWSDGTIVPIENLPIDDIRDALSGSTAATFLTDFSYTTGLAIQYRDATTVFVLPGQVNHRGNFKRQGFDSGAIRQIDVTASLRDPIADGDAGTTSGLKADSWYYGYAKLDVATAYPEYRFSTVAPEDEEGYGLEHPAETKLRFLWVLRTGAAPAAAIRAFAYYHDGRYFWRETVFGPEDPATNLATLTAGYVGVDLADHVPPVADAAFLTTAVDDQDAAFIRVRTTGDTTDRAGYDDPGDGNAPTWANWLEIPVNTIDPGTGAPVAGTKFDLNSNVAAGIEHGVAVIGFHVSR